MIKPKAKTRIVSMSLLYILGVLVACGVAGAQSLDIPSKRWGLSFGNSKEFTGIRFNFRDYEVKRITGINFTLWRPRDKNPESVITGISAGIFPGGGHLRGFQVGFLGVGAAKTVRGISIAGVGLGAGEDVFGINLAGIGLGAGKNLVGINIAGIGLGAGENLLGLNIAGIGLGGGKNIKGLNVAGLGVGGSENILGITIAGLGVGAGENMMGVNIAGLGIGAGKNLSGINITGLGIGAGRRLLGLTVVGLAAGSPEIIGLSFAGGCVAAKDLQGVFMAGGMVYAVKEGTLKGCAVSPFNYIRGSQTGLTIGIVNYAWSVKGVQLGLVNIVRNNPPGLRILPVFNTSF